MTDKTIDNRRVVGGNYFFLIYSRKSKNNLQYYLDQFDINDYWIYKSVGTFREVTIEEFYDFKYACYIFFSKNKYDNIYINEQIKILYSITNGWTWFIKPLPSLEYLNKIQKINIII